ncbi:head-tail connector protein [Anoxybacillus flavithermus]|uniref:head-tail connector protein n=1 Tax=Anoxybacillus flavithermus TaxID=33934 RepID=UPI00186798B4|nr:head-tail connector protein [Anoxybacillus flavithermus]MBE2905402.1 phage gp6-like head-tail connector protein [Anoxybacillus flavithermus]
MLESVKLALRVTVSDFDEEIQDLIDAAKRDLSISGVDVIDETDPLIRRAIITYCKAHFGYDNPDAERLQASYESLKEHLSLSFEYRAVDDNATS